ncbi:MAG: hypothetical protein ABW032_03650 [Burkholderiaceae bacterium]
MKKALWVTSFGSGDFDRLLDHAMEAGVRLLCIRTTSKALPNFIEKFKEHGIDVYGWRWPAVVPGPHSAPHYFAAQEADYVATTLIPAKLAGYIVDPESDGPGQVDDWNDEKHDALARDFCSRIRKAAEKVEGFHFGVTSGCEYPVNHKRIPWGAFVEAADAVYPQTYWRNSGSTAVHGGTPASSYDRGLAAWSRIARGKPVVAIGGELGSATPQEIRDFGNLVRDRQEVVHFYADSSATPPAIIKAIASI